MVVVVVGLFNNIVVTLADFFVENGVGVNVVLAVVVVVAVVGVLATTNVPAAIQ